MLTVHQGRVDFAQHGRRSWPFWTHCAVKYSHAQRLSPHLKSQLGLLACVCVRVQCTTGSPDFVCVCLCVCAVSVGSFEGAGHYVSVLDLTLRRPIRHQLLLLLAALVHPAAATQSPQVRTEQRWLLPRARTHTHVVPGHTCAQTHMHSHKDTWTCVDTHCSMDTVCCVLLGTRCSNGRMGELAARMIGGGQGVLVMEPTMC